MWGRETAPIISRMKMELNSSIYKIQKVVLGETAGKRYYPFRIDPDSHSISVIEHNVSVLHEGEVFSAYYTVTTAATNGHRSGIFIKTARGPVKTHLIASFTASTAAISSICEAVTIAANTGTHGVSVYNRARDSSVVCGCFDNATTPARNKITTLTEAQIAADGTWATGTVIRQEPLETGVGPKPSGGANRATAEYVLKPDTKYVFLITNTVATANTHFIYIDWHEHVTPSGEE